MRRTFKEKRYFESLGWECQNKSNNKTDRFYHTDQLRGTMIKVVAVCRRGLYTLNIVSRHECVLIHEVVTATDYLRPAVLQFSVTVDVPTRFPIRQGTRLRKKAIDWHRVL